MGEVYRATDSKLGRDVAVKLLPAEQAHGRGIVHRDLKPANVRLSPDGSQILDFAWSSDGQRPAVGRYATTNNILLFRGLKRRTP